LRPFKLLHKVKEDEDKGTMYIPLWWLISKYLNQTVVAITIQNERKELTILGEGFWKVKI